MAKKMKMLDLDAMEERFMEVKFGGKVYKIEEPSVKEVHKLIKISQDYQEVTDNIVANPDDKNLGILHDKTIKKLVKEILLLSNEIEDEEFDKLSSKQLEKLAIPAMQFIGAGFTNEKDSGI